MEEIHLDTNCLVYYTNGDDEAVIERMDAWLREGRKLSVSAMVCAEFLCGPLTRETKKQTMQIPDGTGEHQA